MVRYRCSAIFSNSFRVHPLSLIPNYLYPKQIFPSSFQYLDPLASLPHFTNSPFLGRWSCLPVLVKLIRPVCQKLPSSLLKTLNFGNSLFTFNSFKAIGILLLQNFTFTLFHSLPIANNFPLHQQISIDLPRTHVSSLKTKQKHLFESCLCGFPLNLPFLIHINPLSPGWNSYHLISKVFLLLLESATCHTLASLAFWKHRLPLPPSALGPGIPHGSCNQAWERRILSSSQFGSPVPFQPDLLPQNLPHVLLPLVYPITQLSLELPCTFLFRAFPNSH